ncbi:MAG: hypothetical protein EA396_07600 [Anaerolineaceae bacterium]|nr:MAG: hypothetical protein EA396_07600 [Anaerolineaceae bacterium]
MNNQFNPARYARASVYIFLIFAVVLGGFLILSLIRLDRQQEAQRRDPTAVPFLACNFTNTGAEAVALYSAPFADALFQIIDVTPGIPYPVQGINATTNFIRISVSGIDGYVDPFGGIMTGECDARYIPRDGRDVTDYPVVCAMTLSTAAPIYASDALRETVSDADAGDMFIITAQSGDSFFGTTIYGLSGWIAAEAGTVSGACGAIPSGAG